MLNDALDIFRKIAKVYQSTPWLSTLFLYAQSLQLVKIFEKVYCTSSLLHSFFNSLLSSSIFIFLKSTAIIWFFKISGMNFEISTLHLETTSYKEQSLNSSLIIKWLETPSCSIQLLQPSFKMFNIFLHLLSWNIAFKIQILRGIG